MTAEGTSSEPDTYDDVPITLQPVSFTMRPPRTRTRPAVRPRAPRCHHDATFTVTSLDQRPRGYYGTAYADVVLQRRDHGRLARPGPHPDRHRRARAGHRHLHPADLRPRDHAGQDPASPERTASYSPPITLRRAG